MTGVRVPELLRASRGRVRLRGVRTAKLTVAAVLAYVVALPLSDNAKPVLAPLTALLVVQLTLYDTLRTGLRRVVGVVAGVLVAIATAATLDLTWYSLGLVVGTSLVLGRLLRLRNELMEVPISAMLVLAVGGSDTVATGRVLETLVGASVGVAINAAVAPPLYVRPAGDAMRGLAEEAAELLRRIADEVVEEYTREQALGWLNAARELGRGILAVDRALGQAEESLRLNPRARGSRRIGPELRSGLDSLERVTVSLRSVFRTLADRVRSGSPEPVYASDVRVALAALLRRIADVVDSYGVLVDSEVLDPQPEETALRGALSGAWEARETLEELLSREHRLRDEAWQLHGDLVTNVDRVLRELDVDARLEIRSSVRESLASRPGPVRAVRARLPPAPGWVRSTRAGYPDGMSESREIPPEPDSPPDQPRATSVGATGGLPGDNADPRASELAPDEAADTIAMSDVAEETGDGVEAEQPAEGPGPTRAP